MKSEPLTEEMIKIPKLPTKAAEAAKQAGQGSSREPLDEGTYEFRLTAVNAKNAASSGNPMWVWELECVDEPYVGRKQWVNTVLTEKAMWKVAEMFTAFGYPTDTDTDELIGLTCMAEISQRVIESGAKAGQTGNNVDRCFPTEETQERVKAEASGGATVGAGAGADEDPW